MSKPNARAASSKRRSKKAVRSKAAWAATKRKRLNLNRAWQPSMASARPCRGTIAELEKEITGARGLLVTKSQEREGLQNRVREQEKAIEGNRVAVLRLLGEASTLKNQLAQVNEFLASIDRETARSKREEEAAAIESERLGVSREKLACDLGLQQLELESVAGERRRTEIDLGERRKKSAETRQLIDAMRGECSRLRARKESLENVLAHHSYTTETREEAVRRVRAQWNRSRDWSPGGFRRSRSAV